MCSLALLLPMDCRSMSMILSVQLQALCYFISIDNDRSNWVFLFLLLKYQCYLRVWTTNKKTHRGWSWASTHICSRCAACFSSGFHTTGTGPSQKLLPVSGIRSPSWTVLLGLSGRGSTEPCRELMCPVGVGAPAQRRREGGMRERLWNGVTSKEVCVCQWVEYKVNK